MRYSGAQLVVELLVRQGITVVAGIPGGAILPIYDALAQNGRIEHVLARHEQGAGFIAQGMARATGKPAVALASSGPGATNLVTAVADAKLDSVPLVVITGQVSQHLIGTDAFQEVDAFGLGLPIVKHNWLVRSVDELLRVIPEAFRLAASGRPGPVWVDIPKDVQLATLEVTDWPAPGLPDAAPAASPADIAAAAAMVAAAQRPVLYLGGGLIHADAGHLATALAEKAGIPATMTLMGLGAMPTDHPLSLGMLGMHGARYTNQVLHEADLLIACGVRFDDRATGKVAEFCPQARIIHIDIDAAELNKIKTAHVGIVADVGEALEELLPRVPAAPRTAWLSRVDALRQAHPLHLPGLDDPRAPYGLVAAIAELVGDDALITTDVGQHQMWVAQAYPLRRPRRWLTSGGLGTMGFGMPAAIGAALACPNRTVVCFTGDGSILMNVQELATAVDLNVAIKIILLDNQALGLVHQQQTLFYGERIYASRYAQRPDFPALASAFGIPAWNLDDCADPRALLREILHSPGPALIRCPIARDAMVFPMVPPGAANIQMIEGV